MSTILAFDTSGPYCACALLADGAIATCAVEEMTRGQAERLMPLLEQSLASTGRDWPDLSAIAVGTGPGNFTGIRIAISAARGLSLGLGIPAIGVSLLQAQSEGLSGTFHLPAPRDQRYSQALSDGEALGDVVLEPGKTDPVNPFETTQAIARLAARRLAEGGDIHRPKPLYMRPADAAPPRDAPPVILDAT